MNLPVGLHSDGNQDWFLFLGPSGRECFREEAGEED